MWTTHRDLFTAFFLVGVVGFGGGYAMLPLIRHQVVDVHAWLTGAAFSELVALSQLTPGPIATNAATYVGVQRAGIPGALLATTAVCLGPFALSLAAARWYAWMKDNRRVRGAMKALRPVVLGLVAAAALVFMTPEQFPDARAVVVGVVAFALAAGTRLHPALLLVLAGAAGWMWAP